MTAKSWSAQEIDWLRENAIGNTLAQIGVGFRLAFGDIATDRQIANFCRKRNIPRARPTEYRKAPLLEAAQADRPPPWPTTYADQDSTMQGVSYTGWGRYV